MKHMPHSIKKLFKPNIPTLFGAQSLPSLIINFTKGAFFLHLYNEYIGSVKWTAGPSMLPTLNAHGDAVYISKFYRRGLGIRVGDVVSVKHPMFPGVGASKRVLGMPGDFVLRDTPGRGEGMMIQVGFGSFLSSCME